jgi:glycosyltransferase involved in cell wall biosynthesis
MQEYIPYIRTDLDVVFGNVDKYPVIGILTPMYNHGRFLHKSIASVISQDYPNKLLIIIDDKSTDDSLEVAKSFIYVRQELKDKSGNDLWVGCLSDGTQVVLIGLQTNGKQANARNFAISSCWNYCNYYCQLDADDEYLPGKLTKLVDIIKTDPDNIGLVYNDVIINNKITGVTTHEFREPYSYDRLCQEDIISNQPLINKKALEVMGLYDKDISPTEDWDLFLRIAHQFMVIHIPEPLQIYNVVESSCTFTVDKDRWNWCWSRIREKLQARHGN